jgi:hypothetical protein
MRDFRGGALCIAMLPLFKVCVERRFGLAYVRFDHVQLLYNAALKFDATFNVLYSRSM